MKTQHNTLLPYAPLQGLHVSSSQFGGLLLILSLILAPFSSATLIFEDNMDYGDTDGDSAYSPPWDDGSGRTTYETTNVSFSHGSYVNPGNTASTGSVGLNSGPGDPRGAHREFSATALTGDFWISATFNLSSGTDHFIALSDSTGITNTDTPADGFGITVNGGFGQAMFHDESANTYTPFGAADLTLNTSLLLVAKVTVNSGADDSLKMWILEEGDSFSATESSLDTIGARIDITNADFEDGIQQIWVGRNSGNSNFDAFRISDSSGDLGLQQVLVPEPGTLSLVLLSAISMLLIRTKRRG